MTLATDARIQPAALIFAALLIAGCGLSYQLILATLATWLIGNGIVQFSLTIGGFLAAMGVGAWASAHVTDLPRVFRRSELLLSLFGGHSALLLLAAWAWTEPAWPLVFGGVLLVLGGLIGLELPLLLRWARRYAALRQTVARLFAADYLGALLAGLAFPLLLLPLLGLVRTAFVVGLINWSTVLLTYLAFRERPGRGGAVAIALTGLLLAAGLYYGGPAADRIERSLYADPVVHASQSSYQRIVMTARNGDLRLFLDGELQFSSQDEYRYHEALVQPALALAQDRLAEPDASLQVLVIGGGDGLGVRELLGNTAVGRVALVDLDPEMIGLARQHAALRALNRDALSDPRVEIVHADGFKHVRHSTTRHHLIVLDLPDPRSENLARLYSREFYGLLRQRLLPGGVLVTQASSPLYVREAYWTVVATLEAAGFTTLPMHVQVPSFGPWGFVLATLDPLPATLPPLPVALRSLEPDAWARLGGFPPDMARQETAISTLTRPTVWQAYERAMRGG